MSPTRFEEFLSRFAPIMYNSSKIRDVTRPREHLSVTLWHLTSGDAQLSIASNFSISPPTVS